MEERLQRVIIDMRVIQQSLQQSEQQPASPVADLQEEALEELRMMVDKVRSLLWCYHLAKQEKPGKKAKVLEMYCAQQVVDRLRAHRRHAGNC